jgi:hypothetical protein
VNALRADLLVGRTVRGPDGRRAGRIRELVAEVAEAGSGEYVVREFHLSVGGLVEALGGWQLARMLTDRSGGESSLVIVGWRDLDLSDPERPALRRPLAEIRRTAQR